LAIPWKPAQQHAAQWYKEHKSLLKMHRKLIFGSKRASMVEVNISDRSSTGKVWPGKGCVKEAWQYDKHGKNEAHWEDSCGWWGCIKVMKFKWTFGWKHIGANGCEFGNNAWHRFNWWCPKSKRVVEQADFLNPRNFDRCFDDENWADQLLKSLDILPGAMKAINNIGSCMNGLSGADEKWKPSELIGFYSSRAAHPVRLIKDLDSQYLAPTMKSLDPWFRKTVASVMKDGQDLLDNIQNANKNYDIDWARGVVDKGWDNVASEANGLVSVSGMGALRCLKRNFGGPIYRASRSHLAKIVLDIVVPAAKWLADALKNLEIWFQQKISETLSGDDWYSQLTQMVRSRILKTCVDKYRSIDNKKVAKAAPQLELVKVGANLVPMFFEKIKLWSLYHVAQPLAKAITKASREVANIIMHGVDALSGLIPFWGGLVGTLASSAGAVGKQLENTFSHKSIMGGFEQLFTPVEKEVVKFVSNGLEDLRQAMLKNPVGQVVLQLMQKVMQIVGGPLVMRCTDSIKKLVTMKNTSVEELREVQKKLLTPSSTTVKPKLTPKPTPRPTPRPTATPTPVPDRWTTCYEDNQCRHLLRNREYTPGFRRRDAGGVGRDDCIQSECQKFGLYWHQRYWKDCGKKGKKGKCTSWIYR